jgi:hypothetical protein
MSDFLGKRLDRIRFPSQVSVDPEMGSAIRSRASRRLRSLGAQIVYLLTIGLNHDPEEAVHERPVTEGHGNSQRLTEEKSATNFLAQPRTAAHGSSQRKAVRA